MRLHGRAQKKGRELSELVELFGAGAFSGGRLSYADYLGLILDKPRREQQKALTIAHGIRLAFGEKPNFRELLDSDEEVKLAEFEWRKAEAERAQLQRFQSGGQQTGG